LVYLPGPSFTLPLPDGTDGPNRTLAARIVGQTGLCADSAGAGDATICFTCRSGTWGAGASREDLWAFLDYVVLTAIGAEPARPGHRSAIFRARDGRGEARMVGFRPLERARALDYLARLCAELVTGALDDDGLATGVHPYLLPHEAVLASRRNQTPVADEIAELCAQAEADRPSFSSLQGPVRGALDRYAPPTAREAEIMVEARFGLFFDLMVEQGEDET
jgi:hypothetical protein